MIEFTSHIFTDVSGLRTARQEVRDQLLIELFGAADARVRLSPDCYRLETLINGRWALMVTGFANAEDKVATYQGTNTVHRLTVRAARG